MQQPQTNDSTSQHCARQQSHTCSMCKRVSCGCKKSEGGFFFCQECLVKLLGKQGRSSAATQSTSSSPASKSELRICEIDFPRRNKFDVFVETKDDDMSLIGAFYSATKKAMRVAYVGPNGSPKQNTWMFPFESSDSFAALLAKVKPFMDASNYKIWTAYSLKIDNSSLRDKASSSFQIGYFMGCASFIEYSEGIASFSSKEDMSRAKRAAKEVGMRVRPFEDSFLSDSHVTFKVDCPENDLERGEIPSFGHFERFRQNAVMFEYNPISKKFTGEGIMYLSSEEESYDELNVNDGEKEKEEEEEIKIYSDEGVIVKEEEEDCEEDEGNEKMGVEKESMNDSSSSDDDDDGEEEGGKDSYPQELVKLEEYKKGYPSIAYFKNFDLSVGEGGMKELFSEYGTEKFVISVKDGKMYGNVYFKSDKDREKCISSFNEDKKYGERAKVELPKNPSPASTSSSSSSSPSSKPDGECKVFFNGFQPGTSEDDMKEFFKYKGEGFKSIKVNEETTGSGYIAFDDWQSMNRIINEYNETVQGHRLFKVEKYNSSKVHLKKEKIKLHVLDYYCAFVANFPQPDSTKIMEFFEKYDPLGVKIFSDKKYPDRKYAVVFFANENGQKSAITEMNGKKIEENKVYVNTHDYKNDKITLEIDGLPVPESEIEKRPHGAQVKETLEPNPQQEEEKTKISEAKSPQVQELPLGTEGIKAHQGKSKKPRETGCGERKEKVSRKNKQNPFQGGHKKKTVKESVIS